MAIGYQAVEDLCNAALREAGYPRPIAEIFEGSRASRVAVEVYGPCRDGLLYEQDWDFALKEATLGALASGTAILGFVNVYAWPADALRIKQVHGAIATPNNDPQPVRFITGNDATGVKGIWTNVGAGATAVYIGQVTNLAQWSPGFTRALQNRLARIFSFALKDDINNAMARSRLADEALTQTTVVSDTMPPMLPELMQRAAAAAQRG